MRKFLTALFRVLAIALAASLTIATAYVFVVMLDNLRRYHDPLLSYPEAAGWIAMEVVIATTYLALVSVTDTGFFWLLRYLDILPRKFATVAVKIFGSVTLIAVLVFVFVMATYSYL